MATAARSGSSRSFFGQGCSLQRRLLDRIARRAPQKSREHCAPAVLNRRGTTCRGRLLQRRSSDRSSRGHAECITASLTLPLRAARDLQRAMSPAQLRVIEDAWPLTEAVAHDDPLLGCLEFVVKALGRSTPAHALVAGLPLAAGRLTPALYVRAAERAGMSAKAVRRTLDEISDLTLP